LRHETDTILIYCQVFCVEPYQRTDDANPRALSAASLNAGVSVWNQNQYSIIFLIKIIYSINFLCFVRVFCIHMSPSHRRTWLKWFSN